MSGADAISAAIVTTAAAALAQNDTRTWSSVSVGALQSAVANAPSDAA